VKLKEAILTAPNQIEFREREIPPLTGSQVLVKVSMCGVCTTEIPVWLGKTQGKPGASHRYYKYPSCLGHEVSGIVEDVGYYDSHFKEGQAVTGIAYSGSGFSTYAVEDERFWVPIPEGFKPEEVLGEPLACIHNIRQAMDSLKDWYGLPINVLVVGDGFMSLALLGCYKEDNEAVSLVGHHEDRLSRFPSNVDTYNSNEFNAYIACRGMVFNNLETTPWMDGFDIALDFTGTMSGLQLAASLCKPKSRTPLLMCGVCDEEPFTMGHYMVNRGVVPIPCYPAQSDDFCRDLRNGVTPETIRQSRELITHSYKLEEIGRAFEDAMGRRDGYIKGVVRI